MLKPRVTALCHGLFSGEDISHSECIRRFDKGFIKYAAAIKLIGDFDQSNNVMKINGKDVTGMGGLLLELDVLAFGTYSLQLYDPAGGDHEGWSEPVMISLIDGGLSPP